MKKEVYNEQTGIRYELQGDYYLPCLKLSDEEQKPIGIWGQRHAKYLKQHHKVIYYNLLTGCKLNSYLTDINEQAEKMYCRVVKQLVENEGVTKQLKAKNPMLWVQRMNNIQNRARDVVNTELIYD